MLQFKVYICHQWRGKGCGGEGLPRATRCFSFCGTGNTFFPYFGRGQHIFILGWRRANISGPIVGSKSSSHATDMHTCRHACRHTFKRGQVSGDRYKETDGRRQINGDRRTETDILTQTTGDRLTVTDGRRHFGNRVSTICVLYH